MVEVHVWTLLYVPYIDYRCEFNREIITKFDKCCREMTAKFKISAAKWPRNCRFSPRNDREIHVFDLSRYREIRQNLPRQTNAPVGHCLLIVISKVLNTYSLVIFIIIVIFKIKISQTLIYYFPTCLSSSVLFC